MDVKLVVIRGGKQRQALRLRGGETVIGRQAGAGLRIPSATVSRRHCRLRVHSDCVTVEDLGSANGTVLNGAHVIGVQVVRPGDRLEVGSVTFRVEYDPGEPPDELALLPEPVVAEEAIPVEDDEALEALPVEDELTLPADPDLIPLLEDAAGGAKEQPEEEPPVRIAEDEWRMPEADDLRDILSGLDNADDQGK